MAYSVAEFLSLSLCDQLSCVGVLLVIATASWVIYDNFFCYRGFPVGPFRLPLIGNLHCMNKVPYLFFKDLVDRFNTGVVFLRMGSYNAYVVCYDDEGGQKCMSKSTTAARPGLPTVMDHWYKGGAPGINFANGEYWSAHRKLVHSSMLGNYSKRVEQRQGYMAEEADHMIKSLVPFAESGKPTVVYEYFALAAGNVVMMAVLSHRWKMARDKNFRDLVAAFEVMIDNLDASWVNYLSWLSWFPSSFTELDKAAETRDRILMPIYEEHLKNIDKNRDNPRDLVDMSLKLRDEWIAQGKQKAEYLNDQAIFASVVDNMFFGGIDTTSNLLDWISIFLANNQHVQEKLGEEMDRLGREPTLDDRRNNRLPFLVATAKEVLRLRPIFPNIMRQVTKDFKLSGHQLKEGEIIFMNIFHVHHLEKYWKDPYKFDPDRFHERDEGDKNVEQHRYVPFGNGPRNCVGIDMAEDQYFMFFSKLAYHFTFHPPKSGQKLPEDPAAGTFSLRTQKTPIVLKFRKKN